MFSMIEYNPTTGEITGHKISNVVDLPPSNREYIYSWPDGDLSSYYVSGAGELTRKVEMPLVVNKNRVIANGVDMVVIDGVPPNTEVICDGEKYVVSDGFIEFTAEVAGEYQLTFNSIYFLSRQVKIEAIN